MAKTETEAALGDYGALIRRQWPLMLVGLVVGLLIAILALSSLPTSYGSTTSVLVQPTGDDTNVTNGRTAATINLDTEAQVVTSSVVASLAAKVLHSALAPRELVKDVTVKVPANTSVLNITFRAPTAAKAQKGASAFAQAYLGNRKSIAVDRLGAQTTSMRAKITSLNTELRKATDDLARATTTGRANFLSAQRDLLFQQIRTNTRALSPLLTQEVAPGAVITEAQLPTAPTGLPPVLLLASGLIGGLLLGLAGAVVRDRADHRVRTRRDLERLGLDVLVGRFVLAAPGEALRHRHSGDESLRQCRNALLARLVDHRGSVLIASASSGVSGATAAASLAVTLARSGVRTALVCCNTDHDIIEEAFGVTEGPTLADVLRSGTAAADAMHAVPGMPNLSVVPPGTDGALFSELLQDSAIRPVLVQFESLAEVVVLDVAPTSVNADAQTLVTATQGLVLVATGAVTTSEDVVGAVDQITRVNAALLGAMLVTVEKPISVPTRARRRVEHQTRLTVDDEAAHASDSEFAVETAYDSSPGGRAAAAQGVRVKSGRRRKIFNRP